MLSVFGSNREPVSQAGPGQEEAAVADRGIAADRSGLEPRRRLCLHAPEGDDPHRGEDRRRIGPPPRPEKLAEQLSTLLLSGIDRDAAVSIEFLEGGIGPHSHHLEVIFKGKRSRARR